MRNALFQEVFGSDNRDCLLRTLCHFVGLMSVKISRGGGGGGGGGGRRWRRRRELTKNLTQVTGGEKCKIFSLTKVEK